MWIKPQVKRIESRIMGIWSQAVGIESRVMEKIIVDNLQIYYPFVWINSFGNLPIEIQIMWIKPLVKGIES